MSFRCRVMLTTKHHSSYKLVPKEEQGQSQRKHCVCPFLFKRIFLYYRIRNLYMYMFLIALLYIERLAVSVVKSYQLKI